MDKINNKNSSSGASNPVNIPIVSFKSKCNVNEFQLVNNIYYLLLFIKNKYLSNLFVQIHESTSQFDETDDSKIVVS